MNGSYYDAAYSPVSLLVPSEVTFPLYYANRPTVLPGISDAHLSLAAPVVAYWLYSLFFHVLDSSGWVDKYKIHESEEVTKRNKVTPSQVVYAVIFQHAVQTLMGFVILEEEPTYGVDHRRAMLPYAGWILWLAQRTIGERLAFKLLSVYGAEIVQFVYWWVVPTAQFFLGAFAIDTWQYFLHRAMHTNKWLYRKIHAQHHRLYCPYSFGALYNHPVEGFLLDSFSAMLAHWVAGLNTRQDIFLFTVSTLKTVDDHCGLNLPWDPFQFLFGNNADYHDIHHQQFGIKKNFSQPYFIHWDVVLGTRMLRSEAPKRKHTDTRDVLNDKKEL